MCGALASADEANVDTPGQVRSGQRVDKRADLLRPRSSTGSKRPIFISTVLLVGVLLYFTLRGRNVERPPGPVPSDSTISSQPDIQRASVPMTGSEVSPVEEEDFGSPKPLSETLSKTENDTPAELWNRVRQGNTEAEVALAKLYFQGITLERSCEQAHLLLLAASRKGSKEAELVLAGDYARQCH